MAAAFAAGPLAADELKVGVLTTLSGPAAAWGCDLVNGHIIRIGFVFII